ncbi:uncharacterized protein TrAtP1_012382 [Trichoderma atroviride]|uniref:uncharacterized protein n=1 Tax=Hypocrea atroviridis TaxID=63577 RepID=UPI0033198637|nr:hypothetical protein TrAtP1_012382 [Trichoderma atroviride]
MFSWIPGFIIATATPPRQPGEKLVATEASYWPCWYQRRKRLGPKNAEKPWDFEDMLHVTVLSG